MSHFHGDIVCRDCWYIKRLLGNVGCERTSFIRDTHNWRWVERWVERDDIEENGYWQCVDCLRIVLGAPLPAPAQTCGGILMEQVLI
jgi:hypothetical protein